MDQSMSITPNPLRWPPGMPINQPYYQGVASNLASKQIPAMSSQLVESNPRRRGLGPGMNPMEQHATPRRRHRRRYRANRSQPALTDASMSGHSIEPLQQDASFPGSPSLPHQGTPTGEVRIRATEAYMRGLVPYPIDEYPGPLPSLPHPRGPLPNPLNEHYPGPLAGPNLPQQGAPAGEARFRATEAFLNGLVPNPLDEYPGPLASPGFHTWMSYPRPIPTMPQPGGPYIRPAVNEDVEEIAQIINWYRPASGSPLDDDPLKLKPDFLNGFLETCKVRRLPFLVLVCPPELTQHMFGPPTFKIFGVAYIDVINPVVTDDSVGDLHVYVRPGYTRKGFGNKLVDCILSICDEHYRRTLTYEWRPLGPVELHVRRLKQLLCFIFYPAQLEGRYAWTWHWLKNRFGFMLSGEHRQDRAKHGSEDNYYAVHLLINSARQALSNGNVPYNH